MTASATLASASAINSDNALCALKIHRKVSNGVVQSAPLGRQSDADTRSELRISHAAAQARTVYGVGIRLAAFLYPRDLSKGYVGTTSLSSSPACPATQSGLPELGCTE